MNNHTTTSNPTARRRLLALCGAAVAATAALAVQDSAHGAQLEPPPVPGEIAAPAGTKPFLVAHATGTQNYACLPEGSSAAWVFTGPEATLYDGSGNAVMTHFLSANPDENGALRATWKHSRDGSAVWGKLNAPSTDPAFVDPDAIPWLLLDVVGSENGPEGGDRVTAATHLQRVNTTGGLKPTTGCASWDDVGEVELVPYTADYVFLKSVVED